MSPCPLYVPVSTSLIWWQPLAVLCFMHPVTLHHATSSLDIQTSLLSLSTSWPVVWTGLSKLFVVADSCVMYTSVNALSYWQHRWEIKTAKFGSGCPFCKQVILYCFYKTRSVPFISRINKKQEIGCILWAFFGEHNIHEKWLCMYLYSFWHEHKPGMIRHALLRQQVPWQ